MTSTKYFLCRFAVMFGYTRKNIRMNDAASEAHLLKEAEVHLGRKIWKNAEDIDAVSNEYWSLRKLDKEHREIIEELEIRQKDLNKSHEERKVLLNSDDEEHQDLIAGKNKALESMISYVRERDAVVSKAREIKRNYEGIRLKLEVLNSDGESNSGDTKTVDEQVKKLKIEFSELKKRRKDLGSLIESTDQQVSEIEADILSKKAERTKRAVEAFQHIGDGNQTVSGLRSRLGEIDSQIRQLQGKIGKYISRNSQNPTCKKVCGNTRSLVDVMGALKKSIQYNHQLSDMS